MGPLEDQQHDLICGRRPRRLQAAAVGRHSGWAEHGGDGDERRAVMRHEQMYGAEKMLVDIISAHSVFILLPARALSLTRSPIEGMSTLPPPHRLLAV